MFIFDNAPSHRKKPDNSLKAERMNVSDNGRQPVMKDTWWNKLQAQAGRKVKSWVGLLYVKDLHL